MQFFFLGQRFAATLPAMQARRFARVTSFSGEAGRSAKEKELSMCVCLPLGMVTS